MKVKSITRKKRSKLAVSAVLGTVLMIGITVAVGFAAWAWARGAAANSELNFGNSIDSNINYLREQFVVVNVNFSSTNPNVATIWIYNNGNATVYIKEIWVSNASWTFETTSLSSVDTSGCGYCLEVPIGVTVTYLINTGTTLSSGQMYTFKSLGEYGNLYSYPQLR